MPPLTIARATVGDLTLVAHRGDRSVLLAMDLPQARAERLAGFTLLRKPPGGAQTPLNNRLDFATPVTSATTPEERKWHPSTKAPFQKFRWVDSPPKLVAGPYEYTATAMYFGADGTLVAGDSATVSIDIQAQGAGNLTVGFTRGYMSSQAYADQFNNAPFKPTQPSIAFDTTPFEAQYAWLGFHARELIRGFLADCLADSSVTLDVFAYDLNEPDIIRSFVGLGPRLRMYLDNASLHTKPASLETPAAAAVTGAGGTVKRGHFGRFAHSKVLIASRAGVPFRVLTGSTNFSLRGLYVQANNVLVFDSSAIARLYQDAFDQAWTAAGAFPGSNVAKDWFPLARPGSPTGAVAFPPHGSAAVSIGRVNASIQAAQSSVLFAVMELGGGGEVLADLRAIATKPGMFSYGVTQAKTGLRLYKPGSRDGILVGFAYLKSKVPKPFRAEVSGGAGQVIHDKFVVVDFNGAAPKVYTGSSNLAKGGEEANGDNLLELAGPEIASPYAVEAVRQVDHYHFRVAMDQATTVAPLVLRGPDEWHKWVDPYYDPNDLKSLDRDLFTR